MLKHASKHGKRRNTSPKTSQPLPENKITKFCIICKKYPGDVPIFGNKKYPNIPEDVEAVSGISIPDAVNKLMCRKCLILLEQCILFRNLCRESFATEINTTVLKIELLKEEYAEKNVNAEENVSSEDNIKEEITEADVIDETIHPTDETIYPIDETICPTEIHIPPTECPIIPILSKKTFKKFYSRETVHMHRLAEQMIKSIVNDKTSIATSQNRRPKRKLRRTRACDKEEDEDSLRTSSPELEPWNCPNCNQKFYTTIGYLDHYRRTCPKRLAVDSRVDPTGVYRQLLCEICGKSGRYQTIIKHIESHNNNFPYKCDNCPFRAKHRDSIRTHMRKHTEKNKYSCTQCTYSSKYNSNLHNHIRRKHDPTRLECKICGQHYIDKINLKKHIDVIHLRKHVRVCHICQSSFSCLINLQTHLIRQHKITNRSELTRTCKFHEGSYKNYLAKCNETDYNTHEETGAALDEK